MNISGGQWTLKFSQPYYVFTAPEGAPPCEVYNFSVTATYIGATYTGAGCSVPSPVLSRMLPSLPDIKRLQSSHSYSLEKQSGKFIFTVYFQVGYCPIVLAKPKGNDSFDCVDHNKNENIGYSSIIVSL